MSTNRIKDLGNFWPHNAAVPYTCRQIYCSIAHTCSPFNGDKQFFAAHICLRPLIVFVSGSCFLFFVEILFYINSGRDNVFFFRNCDNQLFFETRAFNIGMFRMCEEVINKKRRSMGANIKKQNRGRKILRFCLLEFCTDGDT